MADLSLSPGRVGPVTLTPGFPTADFAALVPRQVSVALALPAAGIEPIRLEALPGGDGFWHAGPVALPLAGAWEVTLRVLITLFESATLRETVTLAP